MKERQILFSAPMVRALLAGTKTQTRRVVKPQPKAQVQGTWPIAAPWIDKGNCPYGQPGDRLWVRETWRTDAEYDAYAPNQIDSGASLFFLADHREHRINRRPECGPHEWGKTRVSIHMPRWASRILLEIAAVRVERLNDISEADARAEGLDWVGDGGTPYGVKGIAASWSRDPRESYRVLWESINGPGSWAANPWVWVLEFRRTAP